MSFRHKNSRRQEDHGADDWLMTYADLITLLLCFFAVFLSVSVPKKEIFDQAKQQVLDQFSANYVLQGQFPTPEAKSESKLPYNANPSIVAQYQGEQHRTGDLVDASDEDGNPNQNENENEGQDQAPEGDRITTIDMPSATLFASGSADLSAAGKDLLSGVLEENLKTSDAEGYQITVEGHTDDVPINTLQFPSNWELSTARAAIVVRFFIDQGIPAQRLRVAGYADSFPKAPNRDTKGVAIPANQAENRRVVIKLEKIEKVK